jgi:hypothetical protein
MAADDVNALTGGPNFKPGLNDVPLTCRSYADSAFERSCVHAVTQLVIDR